MNRFWEIQDGESWGKKRNMNRVCRLPNMPNLKSEGPFGKACVFFFFTKKKKKKKKKNRNTKVAGNVIKHFG